MEEHALTDNVATAKKTPTERVGSGSLSTVALRGGQGKIAQRNVLIEAINTEGSRFPTISANDPSAFEKVAKSFASRVNIMSLMRNRSRAPAEAGGAFVQGLGHALQQRMAFFFPCEPQWPPCPVPGLPISPS